jgi:hypothetical protein
MIEIAITTDVLFQDPTRLGRAGRSIHGDLTEIRDCDYARHISPFRLDL